MQIYCEHINISGNVDADREHLTLRRGRPRDTNSNVRGQESGGSGQGAGTVISDQESAISNQWVSNHNQGAGEMPARRMPPSFETGGSH